MIVYGDVVESVNSTDALRNIIDLLRRASDQASYDTVIDILIDFGIFESAFIDALHPETDCWDGITRDLRSMGNQTGLIFSHAYKRDAPALTSSIQECLSTCEELFSKLPELTIHIKIPEGYAFYSLYPEMYFLAAERFFELYKPKGAVCIGVRSIGVSLCSVVFGALKKFRIELQSFTVRPRGDFFERQIHMCEDYSEHLEVKDGYYYLIIDEGPGLSGSSFSSVAKRLGEFRIPENRIVFFPSWNPSGEGFISTEARRTWPKHTKILVDFEETSIIRDAAASCCRGTEIIDISAGKWRHYLYRGDDSPPVYPANERRKYLICHGDGEKSGFYAMMKFAGLGKFGRKLYARAKILASRGFSPPVLALHNGFIFYEWMNGIPLRRGEVDTLLMKTAAEYVSFIAENFSESAGRCFEEMYDMIHVNMIECAGAYWVNKLEGMKSWFEEQYIDRFAGVDGRMLPHEWLKIEGKYLKTDSTDHHIDHFFPAAQNITWDIAGFISEFDLSEQQTGFFTSYLTGYAATTLSSLPFYQVAYLAYRMGHCTLAADVLRGSDEGKKFFIESEYYARRLKNLIYQFSS